MLYDDRLRNVTETFGFDYDSPCVWVVYPPGCGGDLWAALIGHHYPRTGNHFLGIDQSGRAILHTVDHKKINIELTQHLPVEFDTKFIEHINQEYNNQNLCRSLSGQTIFANHLWQDEQITKIVNSFTHAKVIRILPTTAYEARIARWMNHYKVQGKFVDFELLTFEQKFETAIRHPRLLDLGFNELWSPNKFEQTYDKIVKHLALPYKLVRYDLIKFWFDCQHEHIKPHLKTLFAD